MAEHTKGPWKASGMLVHVGKWKASGKPGDYYDSLGSSLQAAIVADCQSNPLGVEVSRANARLIAAAPELLAALEALVDVAERHREPLGPDCYICPAVDVARAALRKAKGEA